MRPQKEICFYNNEKSQEILAFFYFTGDSVFLRWCQAFHKTRAQIKKAVKSDIGKAYQTPLSPRVVKRGKRRINGMRMINCLRMERKRAGMARPSA